MKEGDRGCGSGDGECWDLSRQLRVTPSMDTKEGFCAKLQQKGERVNTLIPEQLCKSAVTWSVRT